MGDLGLRAILSPVRGCRAPPTSRHHGTVPAALLPAGGGHLVAHSAGAVAALPVAEARLDLARSFALREPAWFAVVRGGPVSISLRCALLSITGAHRASNQDSAAATNRLALVADGVGGHAGGDIASSVVTHVVLDGLAGLDVSAVPDNDLVNLLGRANATLLDQSTRDPRLTGLATTFTGLFCAEQTVRVVHIGDSRAYLTRDGAASRISHDDSYVQLLVDTGALDPVDAWQHPQRNLLTQVLAGAALDVAHVRAQVHDARVGDRWLLCTDGLTDYLAEEEALAMLSTSTDPAKVAGRLVTAALANDARDNVTVAVCDVVEAQDAGRADAEVAGAARRPRA